MSHDPGSPNETAPATVRVQVGEISSVVRALDIEVAASRVARVFERTYRDLAKRARVPGFRPGKAPRSVLEKLYGPGVLEEIERALVGESLPDALAQVELVPVSEPAIEAQSPKADLPFRYTARIEIKPTFTLPRLEGLPGRKPSVEIGVAEVEEALERIRQRHAPIVEEPEGTVASAGHVLHVDFTGRVEGREFEGGAGQDVAVELGSERFLPGFESQLIGARTGERREVTVHFPADYGNEDLAGKEAVFDVAVQSVRRRAVPELDDELAKDVGEFASLEELRARVRSDLSAAREREATNVLQRSVLDALLDKTPFEVPAGLVEQRLQRRLSSAHRELERSVPHEALHQQLSRWQEEWRPLAEREVREALLLEAVARAQGLAAEDAEVDARIERMAGEQGTDAGRLRKAYREAELIEAIRSQIVDEKAVEYLCREAKIEEVSAT
jgi:trigger factor